MDTPMVMVHGGYGRPEVWDGVRAVLDGTGIRFVTPTNPSWGARRAEPVEALSAAAMADDIAAQVGEDGPLHLVGYSTGGVIALELALRAQWPLLSLTLLEPAASPVLRLTEHATEAEEHAAGCYAFAAAVRSGEPDPAARVFEANNGPDYWASLPSKVRDTLNRFAPAAARDAVMEADRRYTRAELGALRVPTLVAHGTRTVPRLRHIAEALAELIPEASLATIEGADHDMLSTHPAHVAALLRRARS